MASDGDGEAWDKIVADYKSLDWLKDMLEIPFLEAQFRSFHKEHFPHSLEAFTREINRNREMWER